MKTCKKCGVEYSEIVMVKNTCYLCILSQWPPKTQRRIKDYKKAVSIRLALSTPLTTTNAPAIVDRIGLERLEFLDKICRGEIISHYPGISFCQRLNEYLDREEK
jgi:hypothetical protein